MRALRFAAPAAMILLPASLTGQQPLPAAKPVVAVMPISVLPGNRAGLSGDGITTMIKSELRQKSQIQLVDGQEVEDLLKQQLPEASPQSEQALLRAGLLLGAQYIVTGSVTVEQQSARFDIRIVDVETGGPARAAFTRSGGHREVSLLVRELAAELTRDLGLAESGAPATDARIPVAASMAYARGLDYEKRGRKDAAAMLFEQALQLFPRHDQARTALERVRGGRQ